MAAPSRGVAVRVVVLFRPLIPDSGTRVLDRLTARHFFHYTVLRTYRQKFTYIQVGGNSVLMGALNPIGIVRCMLTDERHGTLQVLENTTPGTMRSRLGRLLNVHVRVHHKHGVSVFCKVLRDTGRWCPWEGGCPGACSGWKRIPETPAPGGMNPRVAARPWPVPRPCLVCVAKAAGRRPGLALAACPGARVPSFAPGQAAARLPAVRGRECVFM